MVYPVYPYHGNYLFFLNIAIENGPFIVETPIKDGDFPVRYVNVYQRVNLHFPSFSIIFLWFSYGFLYVYQRVFSVLTTQGPPQTSRHHRPRRRDLCASCRLAGRRLSSDPGGAGESGGLREEPFGLAGILQGPAGN